jgi:hypothetical protein
MVIGEEANGSFQSGSPTRQRVPSGTFKKLVSSFSSITIVITEGFGRAAMAAPFYETLAANDGAEISLCGLTRLAGGLSRPEVLLPSRAGMRGGDESSLPVASLSPGATVRLVDQDHLGVIATVREAPRFRRFDGDVLLDALVIDLPNGEPMLVPTANVEVLS